MDDIFETFMNESFELIQDMEEGLLALNNGEVDPDTMNSIFRGAHSIKGSSAALGYKPIYEFTHVMEGMLDLMREGTLTPTAESIDTLLTSVDVLKNMFVILQNGEEVSDEVSKVVVKDLLKYTNGNTEEVSVPAVKNEAIVFADDEDNETQIDNNNLKRYLIKFIAHEDLFESGNEPIIILKSIFEAGDAKIETNLEKLVDIHDIDPEKCYLSWNIDFKTEISEGEIREIFAFADGFCDVEIKQVTQENEKSRISEKPQATPTTKPLDPQASSIRVDVTKVDRMVNMIGEIVITQSMLYAQVKNLDSHEFSNIQQGLEELSGYTRELQDAVMSVRMQPVKSVFARIPRLVRDLGKKLGKKVELETHGEETEVDKTIADQLSDPLTHMIRNSIDHGIESPEKRLENGKSETGIIKLSASHSSGKIIIDIEDDGTGINREKVLGKAKEKGLVPEDVNLSDEEIDQLIFHPGFSTAEEVSETSGRGVGMDVVKRNILDIGGDILIENNPGSGTRISIVLPLTLAIMDGMIIRCGSEKYVIPISSIIETISPQHAQIKKIAGGNDMLNLRDNYIPILDLKNIFKIPPAQTKEENNLIVVIENGKNNYGVIVDELIGQQQVVIKNLEENADYIDGVSGATILGDGKISLIIDTIGLHNNFARKPTDLKLVA